MTGWALWLAVAVGAVPSFKADFPQASVVEVPSGGRLQQASGFSASGLGPSPVEAARAFLARYGPAFGIRTKEKLVPRNEVSQGSPSAVHFERQLGGYPIFDADVVVGLDGQNAVILVNVAEVPARVAGKVKLSKKAAIRAASKAIDGLEGRGEPSAARGWRATVGALRPVWRVEFAATSPAGDWRSYVDAETGKVLLRVDRRSTGRGLLGAPPPTTAGPRGALPGLAPPR